MQANTFDVFQLLFQVIGHHDNSGDDEGDESDDSGSEDERSENESESGNSSSDDDEDDEAPQKVTCPDDVVIKGYELVPADLGIKKFPSHCRASLHYKSVVF